MIYIQRLASLITLFICITLTVPGTIFADGPAESPAKQITNTTSAFEAEVIGLINQLRVAQGLAPVKLNDHLRQAARLHNQDMITHKFVDHTGSDGFDPPRRACRQGFMPYPWGQCFVVENISVGLATPKQVIEDWLESSGHRDNILHPDFREIGVGYANGGLYGYYWTLKLGAQPMVLPVMINNDADYTNSQKVSIYLTKETVSTWGSFDEITHIQVSEDPTFNGAEWQSWSSEVPYTLSDENGLKTVYVKYTDHNQKLVVTDSIYLSVIEFTELQDNVVFLPFVSQ